MSSSSTRICPNVTYSMVDKTSGIKIGIVIMNEGQGVPDLGQMELTRICTAETGDHEEKIGAGHQNPLVGNTLDINENKSDSTDSQTSKNLVSSLVDTLYKKPAQFGWTRKVTIRQCDNYVTSVIYMTSDLEGNRQRVAVRKDIEEFLENSGTQDLSLNNFCFERRKLGFDNLEVIVKYEDSVKKPFEFGWLRKVTIRSSDQRVTCVVYLTPPDHEGKRLRFNYKKDIEKYLKEINNKDLDIDEFVSSRRILGVSSEFESIRYSGAFSFNGQHIGEESQVSASDSFKFVSSKSGVKFEGVLCEDKFDSEYMEEQARSSPVEAEYKAVTSPNKQDSSYDTIISSGSFEDSTDDNSSDSDDNSDSSLDDSDDSSRVDPVTETSIHMQYKGFSTPASKLPMSCGQNTAPSCLPDSKILASSYLTMITDASPSSTVTGLSGVDFFYIPTTTSSVTVNFTTSMVKETDYKPTIASRSPPALGKDSSASPSQLASADSFNPHETPIRAVNFPQLSVGSSTAPDLQQPAAPMPKATLLLVSTEPWGGEGERRQLKMIIKYGVRVGKGMKMFGEKFGLDFRKLRFFSDGQQLTGEEMAGGLDGARIRVEGMG